MKDITTEISFFKMVGSATIEDVDEIFDALKIKLDGK